MPTRREYTAVTTEGDLIAPELLDRIATGLELDGVRPSDYGAFGRRSVADEAERHWDDLKAAWAGLRESIPADGPQADSIGIARHAWIEPLFAELGFGRLAATGSGIASDDGKKRFPVTNRWTHVPVHIADWGIDLEERHGGQAAPHSVVQECLNLTSGHLWGIVTNGRRIRLLRDSTAIAGTAFVEFDLETIFDNELVNEFILLYRLLHVTRFEVADDAPPSACWLEKWRSSSIEIGRRALEQMKFSVQEAITVLGTGFLNHPANGQLIGKVDADTFHRGLLRLTYRLLFWFVVEEKEVLHAEGSPVIARERYRKYYSAARLRAHARKRGGTSHGDLYQGLKLVLDALGSEEGEPKLALPALGGLFEPTEADAILEGLELSNEFLLKAVRALSVLRDNKTRRIRAIDYRHLDAEELGSVYESLLQLVPKYSAEQRRFQLIQLAGNERKTTGSYYTPSSLIERLLDTALDPVINAAVQRGEAAGDADVAAAVEKELLDLKVCDPACGSGHFLVAAARRIAKRLAAVREQNPEPTPTGLREALREVIGRCIYGVDLNPMAVELAKVALWLEGMVPGKALDFLDMHIKCGNSLIGAYPALMLDGIPDNAWNPIEGDDKAVARQLKKRNKEERSKRSFGGGILDGLLAIEGAGPQSNADLARQTQRVLDAPSGGVREVKRKAKAYRDILDSESYQKRRLLADAWCASFFWPKHEGRDQAFAPTHENFRLLEDEGFGNPVGQAIAERAVKLREENYFFHWHLEFPEVFNVGDGKVVSKLTGWSGGFHALIGNPPWEQVQLIDQEFFASRNPEIAAAPTSNDRNLLIDNLLESNPGLYQEYLKAKKKTKSEWLFMTESGRYPLTAQGLFNTYALFTEAAVSIASTGGRAGVIVPTGIATDSSNQQFFRNLVESKSIVTILDFENRLKLFPDVDSRMKFCLITISGGKEQGLAKFAFFLHDPNEIGGSDRVVAMSAEDIRSVNPTTGTPPIFRSSRDARIVLSVYQKFDVLKKSPVARSSWNPQFLKMFDMSRESHLFRTRQQLEDSGWGERNKIFSMDQRQMLRLYEAKMFSLYNHRGADVVKSATAVKRQNQPRYLSRVELRDPSRLVEPLYWAPNFDTPRDRIARNRELQVDSGVDSILNRNSWHKPWLLVWSDVTSSTNERTLVSCIIPRVAVPHSGFVLMSSHSLAPLLTCVFSAFVCDYVVRQKVSGNHLNFYTMAQIAVPGPADLASVRDFIQPRLLELSYTAYDMRPFAEDLGDSGEPFVWDEERRFVMRAELDALFFHLYGIARDDVDYIMASFPIVKKKDAAKFGSFRTKELILEIYDQMAAAGISTVNPPVDSENFVSRLDPMPGFGPRHPVER